MTLIVYLKCAACFLLLSSVIAGWSEADESSPYKMMAAAALWPVHSVMVVGVILGTLSRLLWKAVKR